MEQVEVGPRKETLSLVKLKSAVSVMSCLSSLLVVVPSAAGQNWIQTTAPSNEMWRAVACSADGVYLVAAGASGIHRSTNSGETWYRTGAPPGQSWLALASSADGTKLAAGVDGGFLYTSTNGGATWKSDGSPSNSWPGVACSADGNQMVAVCRSGFSTGNGIYISADAGGSWTVSGAPTNGLGWHAIASSADGAVLAAMTVNMLTPGGPRGWIYTSTNAGITWVQGMAMGWPCSLSTSADGAKLVAATGAFGPLHGILLLSTNSGATAVAAALPSTDWSSVASSADGTRIVAAIGGFSVGPIIGPIYTSTNSGATWTTEGSPTNNWAAVATSADGARSVAAVSGGGIYTWKTTLEPSLDISRIGAGLKLSWTVPSTGFGLQENRDLAATIWTEVPTPPSLNFTNLRYQVEAAPSSAAGYYRLARGFFE